MAKLTESVVETATLEWLGDLGYDVFYKAVVTTLRAAGVHSNVARGFERRLAARRNTRRDAG